MTRSMTAIIHAAARHIRRVLRPWQTRARRIGRKLSYQILATRDRRAVNNQLRGELVPAPVPATTSAD
jgi:hypothetical protein